MHRRLVNSLLADCSTYRCIQIRKLQTSLRKEQRLAEVEEMPQNGVTNGHTNGDASILDDIPGLENVVGEIGGWIPPCIPKKCKYHNRQDVDPKLNPHTTRQIAPRPKVCSSILDAIGNTPMVRLNKIPKSVGLDCEILVKCEFLNPGGSLKDRIGLRMIEDAEHDGRLKPGSVIIEPTSGNTGIGLGMVAGVKGYRMIAVMPEKNSDEKVYTMRAEGVELVRTPTIASYESPESAYRVAYKLADIVPNSVVLDQYRSASNALAHYDGTAEEILDACDDKLDMLVISTGTGGTLTGLERKIKERCPDCKIVAIDPVGSRVAPDDMFVKGSSQIEGIGKDFYPTVADRELVDKWYKATDKGSLNMARRLIKDEGIMSGGSSGCVLYYAIKAAKDYGLKEGDRVVCVFADSIRNYMTKFLSDDWMNDFKYMEDTLDESKQWWYGKKVTELSLVAPNLITPTEKVSDMLTLLRNQTAGNDQALIIGDDGQVQGMVTLALLLAQLKKGNLTKDDQVSKVLYGRFKQATVDSTLGEVSAMLDLDSFVVIHKGTPGTSGHSIAGVATSIELITFLTENAPNKSSSKMK
ncbi:unnamed protein product [Owenia fusiformis]|uniref:cystathionine beta-synthase n=1 Tax=Owenia fusiformis TaxID=6347 RepID=A0A8J1UL89_OWEFU|nr:unnamed protein product [Owenia fusiformis]